MFVLSQNRKQLFNIDNALSVEVHRGEIVLFEPECHSSHVPIVLGLYKDEGRAMEVLEELKNHYATYFNIKGSRIFKRKEVSVPYPFIPPKVYEMPLE